MTEEELHKLHDIFTDCWKYFKQFSDVKGTDEYWESFVSEGDKLYRKHNQHGLSMGLICAISNYLEGMPAKEGHGEQA